MRDARWGAAAGAAVLLFAGCGSDGMGPEGSAAGSVLIAYQYDVVEVNGTVQLSATVLNQSGGVMASPVVTWSSSDQQVATVTAAGTVTGRRAGTAFIRARVGSAADSVMIRVMAEACAPNASRGPVALGGSYASTLEPHACLLPHGLPGEGWQLVLNAETSLAVNMTTSAFAPVVVVTDMNLQVLSYGVSQVPGQPARAVVTLGPGEYRVWATTDDLRTGPYQLSLQPVQLGSCAAPRGTISLGQLVAGTLTESGSCLRDGRFMDIWEFTTATPVTIRADLMSGQMDTFLFLATPAGVVLAADDDGGDGFNSRIIHALAPGTYHLLATTFNIFTLGSYQLAVTGVGSSMANVQGERVRKHSDVWSEIRRD